MQTINKYSKIRFLLSVVLCVFLMFVLVRINPLNLLPSALILIGSILLILNKRRADYISFSIFVFGLVGTITYKIDGCLKSETCRNSIPNNLGFDIFEYVFILLSSMVLIFLISSFFRNTTVE